MAGQTQYNDPPLPVHRPKLVELTSTAYAKVPRDVLRALQRNKALGAETRILAALIDAQYGWSGDQGRPAAITYEQIADAVGLRKRQTIHVVARLRERGAIEIEQSAGRKPNRYQLAGNAASASPEERGEECTVNGADMPARLMVHSSNSATHSNGADISAPL